MAESSTQQAACSEMGALAEAHKKLEALVGTFKAEIKIWMGPGGSQWSPRASWSIP